MPFEKGTIALMGSGELTPTMVEVHKELLSRFAHTPKAVFLDTPAGFQLNVGQIAQKAQAYFRSRVKHPLKVASFKSNEQSLAYEAEQAFQTLRHADYIFIGPGSPTYAVRQWQDTPVAQIITNRIETGGCLVAASAAALTVGRFTLPVYEIYKVGQALHWTDGLNILERFGFNLVVIPHWNNAEGGNHDTRFCFMGEPRFQKLVAALPEDVSIFGLDEHTACIIDFAKDEAVIKGIGRVTLQRAGEEFTVESGDRFPLSVLRGDEKAKRWRPSTAGQSTARAKWSEDQDAFWSQLHKLQERFQDALAAFDLKKTTNALLEIDRAIWQAQHDLEEDQTISQARDILRELIVRLGTRLGESPRDEVTCLKPLIEELLRFRDRLRRDKQWQAADGLRDSMEKVGVVIEDTKEGSRWTLKPSS